MDTLLYEYGGTLGMFLMRSAAEAEGGNTHKDTRGIQGAECEPLNDEHAAAGFPVLSWYEKVIIIQVFVGHGWALDACEGLQGVHIEPINHPINRYGCYDNRWIWTFEGRLVVWQPLLSPRS